MFVPPALVLREYVKAGFGVVQTTMNEENMNHLLCIRTYAVTLWKLLNVTIHPSSCPISPYAHNALDRKPFFCITHSVCMIRSVCISVFRNPCSKLHLTALFPSHKVPDHISCVRRYPRAYTPLVCSCFPRWRSTNSNAAQHNVGFHSTSPRRSFARSQGSKCHAAESRNYKPMPIVPTREETPPNREARGQHIRSNSKNGGDGPNSATCRAANTVLTFSTLWLRHDAFVVSARDEVECALEVAFWGFDGRGRLGCAGV